MPLENEAAVLYVSILSMRLVGLHRGPFFSARSRPPALCVSQAVGRAQSISIGWAQGGEEFHTHKPVAFHVVWPADALGHVGHNISRVARTLVLFLHLRSQGVYVCVRVG